MDVLSKLEILADAAKYDAACTSSGSRRGFRQGHIGNTSSSIAGCCHTFSADGRCVTLLKVLMSNCCVYDCAYCVNRRSNDTRRAAFTPEELADLTINFYRRNYIEGLFLSSGVLRNPDYTMEQMIRAIRILRETYRFNGYIHAKAIPGAAPELVEQLGLLVDRLSCNIELPSEAGLRTLAPEKTKSAILAPMRQIQCRTLQNKEELVKYCQERLNRELIDQTASVLETESDETAYFKRSAAMKQLISENFLNLDEEYLDHFIDEMYGQIYPNE